MFALLRVRDFGLLWFAGLFSFIGASGFIIALPLHIYLQTGSTLATATFLVAGNVPRVMFGSFAGVLVDRWDRRRVMQWSDGLRAIAVLAVLFAPESPTFLYSLAILIGLVRVFFMPAENALLPLLVPKERLVTANALNALNNQLGMLIGPAAATTVYGVWGIRPVILVISLFFFISTGLISLIGTAGRSPNTDSDEATAATAFARLREEWIDGIRVVRRSRTLFTVFVSTAIFSLYEGFFITLGLGPFVIDVLEGTKAQVGLLTSAQSIGGLVAGVIVVKFVHRFSVRLMFVVGEGLVGVCDALTFSARIFMSAGNPAVFWAFSWMSIVGFPVMAAITGLQSLMQNATTDRHRGRVWGAYGTLGGFCMILGMILAGALGQWVNIQSLLIGSAFLRISGALIAARFLPPDGEDHAFGNTRVRSAKPPTGA